MNYAYGHNRAARLDAPGRRKQEAALDSRPRFEQKEQQTSRLTSASVNGIMMQHQLMKLI